MFIRPKGEPARFRRYPFGPGGTRLILPGLAVTVGIILAIIGGLDRGSGSQLIVIGVILVPLGVVFFLLALWMARRGL